MLHCQRTLQQTKWLLQGQQLQYIACVHFPSVYVCPMTGWACRDPSKQPCQTLTLNLACEVFKTPAQINGHANFSAKVKLYWQTRIYVTQVKRATEGKVRSERVGRLAGAADDSFLLIFLCQQLLWVAWLTPLTDACMRTLTVEKINHESTKRPLLQPLNSGGWSNYIVVGISKQFSMQPSIFKCLSD